MNLYSIAVAHHLSVIVYSSSRMSANVLLKLSDGSTAMGFVAHKLKALVSMATEISNIDLLWGKMLSVITPSLLPSDMSNWQVLGHICNLGQFGSGPDRTSHYEIACS